MGETGFGQVAATTGLQSGILSSFDRSCGTTLGARIVAEGN